MNACIRERLCFFVFIGRKPATKQMRKHLRVIRLRVLFFCIKRAQSWARRFEVSPAGSVAAPAKQGHPQDDRNPSRTFHKKESKRVLFLCFYRAQARDEVDAKASTSYTAQGAVFCIKRAQVLCSKVGSFACRLDGCSCVKWYFQFFQVNTIERY